MLSPPAVVQHFSWLFHVTILGPIRWQSFFLLGTLWSLLKRTGGSTRLMSSSTGQSMDPELDHRKAIKTFFGQAKPQLIDWSDGHGRSLPPKRLRHTVKNRTAQAKNEARWQKLKNRRSHRSPGRRADHLETHNGRHKMDNDTQKSQAPRK